MGDSPRVQSRRGPGIRHRSETRRRLVKERWPRHKSMRRCQGHRRVVKTSRLTNSTAVVVEPTQRNSSDAVLPASGVVIPTLAPKYSTTQMATQTSPAQASLPTMVGRTFMLQMLQERKLSFRTRHREMILYVYTHLASSEVSDIADKDAARLQCATVVLQHPEGPVGFNKGQGDEAIKALVRDVVVIECTNSPDWMQLRMDTLSRLVLHSQSVRSVTCSMPRPDLVKELETVTSNKLQAKKNSILARHAKPQIFLARTIFDDWITPNGLLVDGAVRWLIDSCQTVVLWRFSVWGMYASILARSSEEALEPVLQAGWTLRIAVEQVHSTSELPVW